MTDVAAVRAAEVALKRFLRRHPLITRDPSQLTDWVSGYIDAWQAHAKRDLYDVAGAWKTPASDKSALYQAGYATYVNDVDA